MTDKSLNCVGIDPAKQQTGSHDYRPGSDQRLVDRVASAIMTRYSDHGDRYEVPDCVRRYAQATIAAITACHAEEMRALLALIANYPDANVVSDAHYVIRKHARALLASLDDEQKGEVHHG